MRGFHLFWDGQRGMCGMLACEAVFLQRHAEQAWNDRY